MMQRFMVFLFAMMAFCSPAYSLSDQIYSELDVFTQIIEIVDKQYVEEVDEHTLIQGAIQGMLSALDPHTIYLSPDMYREFQSDTTGRFGGVGIEITIKDGIITIVSPLEDSPAFTAGLQSGDRILKIDGQSTKGVGLFHAVQLMRGSKGKKVVLTIWREGLKDPLDVSLTRQIIKMKSVKEELLAGGYAFVRINSFQEDTTEHLILALEQLKKQNGGPLKGIVLDLRDNPGGLFGEAITVSDVFMSGGIIVSTRGRSKNMDINKAKNNSAYEETPLVVLVNRGSASAAEIVAGALQDSKRAKLLGTQSFGKGSVQTLLDMGNKAALKITIAKYYTPKGRSIDGLGIEPDVKISWDDLKKAYPNKAEKDLPVLRDFQKQQAIEFLKRIT